jgi:aryl-alcohol dehydrogenase-like predicted oxidoreductase
MGTMTFGGGTGIWAQIGDLPQTDGEQLIGQALDAGINFIDTADVYAGGASEQITGQALKNLKVPRENIVIATKVFDETGSRRSKNPCERSINWFATATFAMSACDVDVDALTRAARCCTKRHSVICSGRWWS